MDRQAHRLELAAECETLFSRLRQAETFEEKLALQQQIQAAKDMLKVSRAEPKIKLQATLSTLFAEDPDTRECFQALLFDAFGDALEFHPGSVLDRIEKGVNLVTQALTKP